MREKLIAINTTRGSQLAHCGRVADTLITRVIGLLRDKDLAQGGGLWIVPCNSIHSFAMKFVFDAVFLDKELRVVHVMHNMPPWRISSIHVKAHSVLELPAGLVAQSGTGVGDQLEMRREPVTA